jgi:hypothetical protein
MRWEHDQKASERARERFAFFPFAQAPVGCWVSEYSQSGIRNARLSGSETLQAAAPLCKPPQKIAISRLTSLNHDDRVKKKSSHS